MAGEIYHILLEYLGNVYGREYLALWALAYEAAYSRSRRCTSGVVRGGWGDGTEVYGCKFNAEVPSQHTHSTLHPATVPETIVSSWGRGEVLRVQCRDIHIYIIAPRYLCAMFASHQILQATLVGEQHCMWELNTQSLNGPLASEGGGII